MRISDWSSDVCSSDLAFQQRDQRRGGVVLAAHLTGVAPHQRQVVEVAALAVAIAQPAEDAEHFQMPLQAHQIEPAAEGGAVGIGETGGLRALTVAFHPGVNARIRSEEHTSELQSLMRS